MEHEKPLPYPAPETLIHAILKIQVNGCPGITRKPSSLLNNTFSNLSSLHTTGRFTSPQEIVSAVTLFFGATFLCRKDTVIKMDVECRNRLNQTYEDSDHCYRMIAEDVSFR